VVGACNYNGSNKCDLKKLLKGSENGRRKVRKRRPGWLKNAQND
jgi:hypothetical protein